MVMLFGNDKNCEMNERMNAEQYLNSQVGDLCENLKKAFLAGQNIVYVVSDDYSVVNEALREQPVILYNFAPKQVRVGNAEWVNKNDPPQTIFFGLEELKNCTLNKPCLYIVTLTSDKNYLKAVNEALIVYAEKLSGIRRIHLRPDDPNQMHLQHQQPMVVVVTATMPTIPEAVQPYCRIIEVKFPSDDEIQSTIINLVKTIDGVDISGNEDFLRQMVLHTKGFTIQKIRQTFNLIKAELGRVFIKPSDEKDFKEMKRIIIEEKTNLLAGSEILRLQAQGDEGDTIGGMGQFIHWLEDRERIMKNPDKAWQMYHLPMPKGVLLFGIPGSGKSLAAKIAAAKLGNLPLLRLDMGSVMDKFQGESEHKMEAALRLSEAMSPCVVWIDEIEKALAGSSGGSNSSESIQRIIGKLLTWMQEKDERGVCCFVFATANRIDDIPPELFRSGRFDGKFYTFFPSVDECCDIFIKNILKQNEDFLKGPASGTDDNILSLFDPAIADKSFFKEILNDDIVLQVKETNKQKVSYENSLRNKFMTGSDIVSILEQAKLIIYNKDDGRVGRRKYVFEKEKFEEALKEAIKKTKTYSQTNARDVAKCFALLADRNFEPVTESVVVPFECLDMTQMDGNGDLFVLDKEIKPDYNAQLRCYVGLAVNHHKKAITEMLIKS